MSPSQFVLLDLNAGVAGLDTAYLAVDATVQKFTFNGTAWAAAGTATSSNGNVIGVTAKTSGSNVTVFATTSASLISRADTASGTLSGAFSSLTTAATNTAFRGAALAPESGTTSTSPTGSNVLNYFITFGGANDRGADNLTEFVRQKAKIVAGLKGLNAAIVGLSELQNNGTGTGSAFNDLVKSPTGLNAAMTAAGLPTYEVIGTPSTPFGTDAIQVGLMYQPSLVTFVGVALTDTANFATYSRPPLAQLFSVNATGGKFWVVVNHFKSKGPSGATGADVDQNDGQGAYNFRRKNQSNALVSFINTTLAPTDPDVLVVGDLNAYGQEDPIDIFRAAGFTDLIAAGSASEPPYSYLFDGQLGHLDHALASASLAGQATGAIEWHVNAAEPRAIDYDLSFKTDDQFVANLYE